MSIVICIQLIHVCFIIHYSISCSVSMKIFFVPADCEKFAENPHSPSSGLVPSCVPVQISETRTNNVIIIILKVISSSSCWSCRQEVSWIQNIYHKNKRLSTTSDNPAVETKIQLLSSVIKIRSSSFSLFYTWVIMKRYSQSECGAVLRHRDEVNIRSRPPETTLPSRESGQTSCSDDEIHVDWVRSEKASY